MNIKPKFMDILTCDSKYKNLCMP